MSGTYDYAGYIDRYADLREYARANNYRTKEARAELGKTHWEKYGKSEGRSLELLKVENLLDRLLQAPEDKIIASVSQEETVVSKPRDDDGNAILSSVKNLVGDVNPVLFYTFAGLAALIVLKR